MCVSVCVCGVCVLSLIHISEPTRPVVISYAVFCLKKGGGGEGGSMRDLGKRRRRRGYGGGGEREIIYLSLHCHHQNDSCIKMGSDESHFNVSVGNDGQSQRTVSTNHNIFEQKGEPKRYRTEVLPLTSLTPYR